MNGRSIGLIALGIVFGVNTILLLWLVSLKAFHRHRTDRRAARRAAYLAAISRHLADPHHAVPITAGSRDDDVSHGAPLPPCGTCS